MSTSPESSGRRGGRNLSRSPRSSHSPSRTPSPRRSRARSSSQDSASPRGRRSPSYSPDRRSASPRGRSGRRSTRSPLPRSPSPDRATLVVKNLTRNVSGDHLEEIFGHYGAIKEVERCLMKPTLVPKPFAFVSFIHRDDAAAALEAMHEGMIDGQVVQVVFKEADYNRGRSRGRGRGGGGGRGNRRWGGRNFSPRRRDFDGGSRRDFNRRSPPRKRRRSPSPFGNRNKRARRDESPRRSFTPPSYRRGRSPPSYRRSRSPNSPRSPYRRSRSPPSYRRSRSPPSYRR